MTSRSVRCIARVVLVLSLAVLVLHATPALATPSATPSATYPTLRTTVPPFPGAPHARAFANAPDGSMYIGGRFTEIGGQPVRFLAHVLPDGTIDTSFAPDPNDAVSALAINASGTILYVGGWFTQIGGQPRQRMAAIDLTTGQASAFRADTGTWVDELLLSPDGATLFAGAGFGQVNNVRRNCVASLDASTGSVDPNFDIGLTRPCDVRALAITSDGATLYVGGTFTQARSASVSGLMAVDATSGAVDGRFSADIDRRIPPSSQGTVYRLLLSPDQQRLYVGGSYQTVNNQGNRGLNALNTNDGSLYSSFDAGSSVSTVYDLAVSGDGNTLYVGGVFSQLGGVAASMLAAVDGKTGQGIASFLPQFDAPVFAVTLDPPERSLFAGGLFTRSGSRSVAGLARFDERTVEFAVSAGQASEWVGSTTIDVQLNALAPQQDVTVTIAVGTGSTATVGSDFRLPATSVTIPRGQLQATIRLDLVNDSVGEPSKTVVLTLQNASGALIGGRSTYTFTILDDDGGATRTGPPGTGATATFGRCSGSGAACGLIGATPVSCAGSETCDPIPCATAFDCRIGTATGQCDNGKDQLTRDILRLEDLNELRFSLATFGAGRRQCSVTNQACDATTPCPSGETCVTPAPALSSGTFLPGTTTSRWPSWQQELGRALGMTLAIDPINRFGGQCVAGTANADYDQETCWNQNAGVYTCPAGSSLYQYTRTNAGQVTLSSILEYAGIGRTLIPALPTAQPQLDVSGAICSALPVSATGRCGDGVLQAAAGEWCDPPGQTGAQTSCTLSGGGSGFQFQICQRDCTWSQLSACGAQCGNGVVDGTCTAGAANRIGQACSANSDCGTGGACSSVEQCDVGASGGRVPASGGTVPGVTPNTAYECSSSCQWETVYSGGTQPVLMRCGDGIVESAYGEQCDGTANVATTAQASSAATRYGCFLPTDRNPCRVTGGFCGDRNLDSAPGEQCDGDESRSCVQGVCSNSTSQMCDQDSDCGTGNRCIPLGLQPTFGEFLPPPSNPTSQPGPWTPLRSLTLGQRHSFNEMRLEFPVTVQFQATPGDFLLTVETSNDRDDLSPLNRSAIESGLGGTNQTIADFNPLGARGGVGLYHRLRVESRPASSPRTGPWQSHGVIWALATGPSAHQTSLTAIRGIPTGDHIIRLHWDNDWTNGPLDSNVVIYRVTVAGTQTRRCGVTGDRYACQPLDVSNQPPVPGAVIADHGWSACQAGAVTCGNGTVDPSEQCDDGGAGRCTNDPLHVCRRDSDCGVGATCNEDADACTSRCTTNRCDDGAQLEATCTAGAANRIGQPCHANSECGAGGACSREECDTGVSNWRAVCQVPIDAQCVPNATCPYGRTCNYCLTGTCSVVSRNGGFCGDGLMQSAPTGPEVCDDGTAAVRGTLQWNSNICNATCTARCPATPEHGVATLLSGPGGTAVTEVSVVSGAAATVRLPAARLYTQLHVGVVVPHGVSSLALQLRDPAANPPNSPLLSRVIAVSPNTQMRPIEVPAALDIARGGVCANNISQPCVQDSDCGTGNICRFTNLTGSNVPVSLDLIATVAQQSTTCANDRNTDCTAATATADCGSGVACNLATTLPSITLRAPTLDLCSGPPYPTSSLP